MKPSAAACVFAIVISSVAFAQAQSDDEYISEFLKIHPRIANPPTLPEYANVPRYDQLYMQPAELDEAIKKIDATNGGPLAWGVSYRMQSLNQMFRVTGDVKYLTTNFRFTRAILANRDDRKQIKTYNGEVLPAWSAGGYSGRGRSVFLVHTGMILYPMLDAAKLARSTSLEKDFAALVPAMIESLHAHDREWRDGPGKDGGHFIGVNEEPTMDGHPQPFNRLSAIGRAMWVASELMDDKELRRRCIATGWYIKHRLPIAADDGAYYWKYRLDDDPTTQPTTRLKMGAGEDSSHAGLSITFPIMLARNGEAFTADDIKRFAKTYENGAARLGGGIILGDVCGNPKSKIDRIGSPAKWLDLAQFDPAIADRILPYFLNFCPTPTPLDLSSLIAHQNWRELPRRD